MRDLTDIIVEVSVDFEHEMQRRYGGSVEAEKHVFEWADEYRSLIDKTIRDYQRAEAEAQEQFLEDYYNDPEVQYGWYQQDLIDMRRRER